MKITRRQMLTAGGVTLLGTTLGRATLEFFSHMGPNDAAHWKFALPLRVPPILKPVHTDAETDYYQMTQKETDIEILSGKRTRIWGYEGMFPGPTIRARCGRRVVVRQTNRLPVDTVTHLHGGVTEADSDGFPTDMVMPGQSRSYVYSNLGRATTLWYHDHAMDHTAHNICMGLAGLYLLEDDSEARWELPSDHYDIPLILQGRSFHRDGNFAYDGGQGGRMGEQGKVILVNGVPWPHYDVAAHKYRFRILNGSNATVFQLALKSGHPLVQIATDGGLLSAPVKCSSIPLAMAERTDVIVDFSEFPIGAQILLCDLNAEGQLSDIMRFNVVRVGGEDSEIPEKFSEIQSLDPRSAVRTRVFEFGGSPSLTFPPVTWTIDGKRFDPNTCLARVGYGQVEIWHLKNRKLGPLGMLHPVHIHLVKFQILERNGCPPMPWERGGKDTVSLDKGEELKFIMKFDGYRGRYLIHCHNLEHEDHSMMARFDVV